LVEAGRFDEELPLTEAPKDEPVVEEPAREVPETPGEAPEAPGDGPEDPEAPLEGPAGLASFPGRFKMQIIVLG